MKRATIVALVALLLYPAAASAGFNSPLHHASITQHAEDDAVPGERCPELSNPIECRHRDTHHVHVRTPARSAQCDRDRDLYLYHHPTGKPKSLRGYTGCHLYAKDARYHRLLGTMPDPFQEALEDIAAGFGFDPEVFANAALSNTPT